MTKPIPDGYTTLTASLIVKNTENAIEFYKKAFGAQEFYRFLGPDGKTIMHTELQIGNSRIMLSEEAPQMNCKSPQSLGGTGIYLYMYIDDADSTFNKAVAAGATPTMPVTDMFWGDRFGQVQDPFGHIWSIATHKKDMSLEEVNKAGQEFFKNMQKK
jgi:uncharacterized glyoxalase superfamily protein PhnB